MLNKLFAVYLLYSCVWSKYISVDLNTTKNYDKNNNQGMHKYTGEIKLTWLMGYAVNNNYVECSVAKFIQWWWYAADGYHMYSVSGVCR